MTFKPCGYDLDRLAQLTVEQHQRGQANRTAAMQRNAMKEGTAKFLDRYEAAVIAAVAKLKEIEQHHPHLLETPQ